VILSDNDANAIFGTASDVTFTNLDNTISGAGQLGGGQLALINSGTIIATGADALVIDTGANIVTNSGMLEATGSGGLSIVGAVSNTGTLWADGGNIIVHGAVTGAGTALINGTATLEFGAASSAATIFALDAAGTLKLDDSFHFGGTVSGFDGNDRLDIADVQFATALALNYAANADGTGGTLTVSDGTHTANITLLGHYDAAGFHQGADHSTGVLLTYSDPIPLL
jgi:hypothetical protein